MMVCGAEFNRSCRTLNGKISARVRGKMRISLVGILSRSWNGQKKKNRKCASQMVVPIQIFLILWSTETLLVWLRARKPRMVLLVLMGVIFYVFLCISDEMRTFIFFLPRREESRSNSRTGLRVVLWSNEWPWCMWFINWEWKFDSCMAEFSKYSSWSMWPETRRERQKSNAWNSS